MKYREEIGEKFSVKKRKNSWLFGRIGVSLRSKFKIMNFTTAREHLQKVLLPTHLIYSPLFSEESGNEI